jgi:hypothetical protein
MERKMNTKNINTARKINVKNKENGLRKLLFIVCSLFFMVFYAGDCFAHSNHNGKVNSVPATTTTATVRGAISTPPLTVPIHIMKGPQHRAHINGNQKSVKNTQEG